MNDQTLPQPNMEFATPASPEALARAVEALTRNGMSAEVADTGQVAKERVLSMIPEGAEVHAALSKTVEALDLPKEFDESGRYNSVRARYMKMDRATQADEIRALVSRPQFIIGSVHAITENGEVIVGSATGSQLGPYLAGAGRVIWIVGQQKIVPDLDTGSGACVNTRSPWKRRGSGRSTDEAARPSTSSSSSAANSFPAGST